MVIWVIGLAGAGKTSIGREVFHLLKKRNQATVLLDGDLVREVMGQDLGYGFDDREKNGWRICKLSSHLDQQGIDVVACVLSNYPAQQQWNRDNYGNYFEVFIDVPLNVLEERDQKSLYSQAKAGRIKNVVGVDIPFTPPAKPDLIIKNSQKLDDFSGYARDIVSAMDVKLNVNNSNSVDSDSHG